MGTVILGCVSGLVVVDAVEVVADAELEVEVADTLEGVAETETVELVPFAAAVDVAETEMAELVPFTAAEDVAETEMVEPVPFAAAVDVSETETVEVAPLVVAKLDNADVAGVEPVDSGREIDSVLVSERLEVAVELEEDWASTRDALASHSARRVKLMVVRFQCRIGARIHNFVTCH
jgi:hypothetical protein